MAKARARQNLRPPSEAEEKFDCEFCKRAFTRESALLAHACERRNRWLNRDEKYVKLGFFVFQRLHDTCHRGKKKTYTDFMNSRLYIDFVKFGRYLLHINAINPESFIEFILKTGAPLAKWQHPAVYETYIRELSKKETASAAVERNILLMEQWSVETGEPWTDFFRKVSPALATHYIRSGRLSPWVLYTAPSAETLFSRMSTEQVNLIKEYVDPGFWQHKLERHTDDVEIIKTVLQEAGV